MWDKIIVAHKFPTLAGLRILIVEDELLVAMEMESLLEDQDCDVAGLAPTVPAALDQIAANAPDAAVLDLNLDGHSTIDIARALDGRGIPFIIVTGYDPAALNEPSLQGRPIVQKPWRGEDLLSRLAQAIAPTAPM